MANNCSNFGSFTGEPKNIKKLIKVLEKIQESATGFECHVSLFRDSFGIVVGKTKIDETIDPYDEYGSKWFECSWESYREDGVNLFGDSAWSPVLPFFQKICKKYKLECTGDYSESGNDFAGTFFIDAKGNLEEEQMSFKVYEAKYNPDSFWEDAIYLLYEDSFTSFEELVDYFTAAEWILDKEQKEKLENSYEEYRIEKMTND